MRGSPPGRVGPARRALRHRGPRGGPLLPLARRRRRGLAQTTWLRALEHVDQLNDPDRFVGWLVTIARREVLRTIRAASRSVPLEEGILCDEPDTDRIDARILAEERDAALRRALGALRGRHESLLRI